jgi:hypothetical protein
MFDLIEKKAAIVPVDSLSPVAYINVFEKGDMWVKTQNCNKCSIEGRKICCGTCPFALKEGCMVHIQSPRQKPFLCVMEPSPDKTRSYCALEFECVEGSRKGVTKKICEPIPWQL